MVKIMISAILFSNIIFGFTYATLIFPSNNSEIYECALQGERCEPMYFRPCCKFNNGCKKLGRGAIQSTYRCLKLGILGSRCQTNSDCINVDFSECDKNNNRCQCIDNFVAKSKSQCSPLIKGFCITNEDCKAVDNSGCIDNRCQCKSKFIQMNNTYCMPTVLGNPCKEDNDCDKIFHTKCSKEKKCVCRDKNVVINDASCSPLLGGFCWNNEFCATNNTVCENNECYCDDDYLPNSNNECVLNNFGKNCSDDNDCAAVQHATCSEDKICICKTNFISYDGSTCLQIFGQFCTEDKHCVIQNSICHNDRCDCASNTIFIGGQCKLQYEE